MAQEWAVLGEGGSAHILFQHRFSELKTNSSWGHYLSSSRKESTSYEGYVQTYIIQFGVINKY